MMLDLHAEIVVAHPSGFTVDVAFDLPAGQTTALLGPNGAGKSTVVSALAGLTPLTRGFVRLGNRVIDDPDSGTFVVPGDRHVGVVFQDALLFPHMTVQRNIEFGPKSLKRDPDRTGRLVAEWIDRLELHTLVDRHPSELSGGEVQRVAIARTMVTEPDALILDEPLAAIDASARPSIRRVLSDFLTSFEGPVMVITHDPTEAFLLADSVVIIEDGRITQTGTPDEIRMRPVTRYGADLAGLNLWSGRASDGTAVVGTHTLHIADTQVTGDVIVTIHPRAVSLHRQEPEGSPRNTWETSVRRLEDRGDTVRVATEGPLELIAEVTTDGARATGLAVGAVVWVSIKATEIGIRGQKSEVRSQKADD